MEMTVRELLELIAAEVGGQKTEMKDVGADISELKKEPPKLNLTTPFRLRPQVMTPFNVLKLIYTESCVITFKL